MPIWWCPNCGINCAPQFFTSHTQTELASLLEICDHSLAGYWFVCKCGHRDPCYWNDHPKLLTSELIDKYWRELQSDPEFFPPTADADAQILAIKNWS
jgi:hypothetical protein